MKYMNNFFKVKKKDAVICDVFKVKIANKTTFMDTLN